MFEINLSHGFYFDYTLYRFHLISYHTSLIISKKQTQKSKRTASKAANMRIKTSSSNYNSSFQLERKN